MEHSCGKQTRETSHHLQSNGRKGRGGGEGEEEDKPTIRKEGMKDGRKEGRKVGRKEGRKKSGGPVSCQRACLLRMKPWVQSLVPHENWAWWHTEIKGVKSSRVTTGRDKLCG